ncbi:MAG: amino acid adenylation domain-containing protein, partial [Acidobacteria bacterium]|nr:amino acid adenylation domain-containing protein [Acidobacteriota bacterium]
MALRAGTEELSYGELNEAANRVAHLLRERGVGVGELVAVCLERTAASVVALLGIWKAGAAYLPLDVEQPAARLQLMLEEAAPVLVLTTAVLRDRLGLERALCLDHEVEALARQPVHNPELRVAGETLAYVIYTSGSTGRPKGVMVEHGQLRNTLLAAQEFYQFTAAEVMACVAPFAFDISLFELLSPLLVGGRVVLVGGRELLEPETAATVLSEVTFLHSAPGLMRQLAGYLKASASAYRQIRGVMVGGDAVSPELLAQLQTALPQAQLYVGYGPTEAAIMCAAYAVPEQAVVEQRMLGYPLANTKLRLYDAEQQLVPVGVAGELYIGGASVSRGYLQSAELTREKFVEVEGERWYRSGDLGRRLADGSIAFVGRADGQVKVRGYRIEVGEVEAALESAAGVQAAAVALKPDGRGEGPLVGYVVLEQGAEFNQGELRRQVAERLPEYMVPVVLVELKELPLTALAKVDRKALPEIDSSSLESHQAYAEPRTPVEEMLVHIWATTLKLERVGAHDNFFELGGDSLLATQLIARVRETLQVEVALRELFEQPTVAGFAECVEAALRADAGVSAPPLRRVERREQIALSFAQQRLWFIEQLRAGSPLYNMPHAVRMLGQLNVNVLERTVSEIVRRHEILRTTFKVTGGQPMQVVHPPVPVKLAVIDLSAMDQADREVKARQLITQDSTQPFDLNHGPLLRVGVIKLAEDEHITFFTTHHIISDGWSVNLLIREVVALYTAFNNDEPSPLPELPIQYADFSHWQREWLQGEVLAQQVAYWREQLAGAPAVLELPLDHPRPAVQSHRGARQPFTLPDGLKLRLEELSRREGVTLFMTLLGAWQTLLMRYSGQQDIIVGIPVANRQYKDTEPLIGFFVNMLALRTDLSGDLSFRGLLKRVREVALGAYAHQDLPFEKLVEELQPVRSMSHTPFFQVIFGLETLEAGGLQLPDLELSLIEQHTGTAIFDLSLGMAETSAGLGGVLEYNTDIFERETIERITVHYQHLLEAMVADPEQRVGAVSLLTSAEEHYLREEVNDTAREFATEWLAHELFEQQVARTPAAVALRA